MRYAASEDEEELPHLRRLRRMVMALMVVLMLGIVAIAATIVIRLGLGGDDPVPRPITAASLILPADHQIIATGRGPGEVHFTVVSPDGAELLIVLDAASGAERSRTLITRP